MVQQLISAPVTGRYMHQSVISWCCAAVHLGSYQTWLPAQIGTLQLHSTRAWQQEPASADNRMQSAVPTLYCWLGTAVFIPKPAQFKCSRLLSPPSCNHSQAIPPLAGCSCAMLCSHVAPLRMRLPALTSLPPPADPLLHHHSHAPRLHCESPHSRPHHAQVPH